MIRPIFLIDNFNLCLVQKDTKVNSCWHSNYLSLSLKEEFLKDFIICSDNSKPRGLRLKPFQSCCTQHKIFGTGFCQINQTANK